MYGANCCIGGYGNEALVLVKRIQHCQELSIEIYFKKIAPVLLIVATNHSCNEGNY